MTLRLALWALAILPYAIRAKDIETRQAPSYAASSLVNLVTGRPGPFAPNTLVALYGRDLSINTAARASGPTASATLPIFLGSPPVHVNISGMFAPLEYVSPDVVVFLIPADQFPGPATIRLVRNNLNGPLIRIVVDEFAPALFENEMKLAFARHAQGLETVSELRPASPGETIVLYAAGLGEAARPLPAGEAPREFLPILHGDQLRVMLGRQEVEARYILNAGLAAGRTGCYEIVLELPPDTPEDPEITIAMGDAVSQTGLRLPVRWPGADGEPQPASVSARTK
ncbi:MAG TPA: hypothetical protein VGK29_25645 [Paludibaculum sp.]|jgi:uncharacterized protein (TIGR03437 family)